MQPPKTLMLLAALVVAGACGDDLLGPEDGSLVQFVNATTTTVVGTAESEKVSGGVPTNMAATACAITSPGSALGFSSLDTSIASVTGATTAGLRYTAVLYGAGAGRTAFLVPEVISTFTAGNLGLRIINATSETGNIYVTTPTGATTGPATTTLATATATGGATGENGFLDTPTTNTRVRFFGAASTTTPLASFTLPTPLAGQLRTVVFTNTATGGVTAFAFTQCELPGNAG